MITDREYSACACVELLESRRLLSAAPTSVVPASVESPAAAHATLPILTGAPFTGTANSGTLSVDVTIAIATESKTGKVSGTFTETFKGEVSVRSLTGSVNAHGILVLHAKKQVKPHLVVHPTTFTIKVSADANTLSGKFVSAGTDSPVKATFTATRA